MVLLHKAESRPLGMAVSPEARRRISDALFVLATAYGEQGDTDTESLIDRFLGRTVLPRTPEHSSDDGGMLRLTEDEYGTLDELIIHLGDVSALNPYDEIAALYLLDSETLSAEP